MSRETSGLTPGEHDEMRDLLLAGTQRIRPAGRRRSTLIAGAVSLVLVGAVIGGAVVAFQTRTDTTPATTPTPSTSAGCPDRLAAWVTLGDEFDVMDEPLTEVPAVLAAYVPDPGAVSCSFASADGSQAIVATVRDEAAAVDAYNASYDALVANPSLAQVSGSDGLASFMPQDESGRLLTVWMRDARFSADVGLDRSQRVVMVFQRTSGVATPAACLAYEQSPAVQPAPGGEAIAAVAGAIDLGAGTTLSPPPQVTAAAGQSGRFDVIVSVCSDPLTRPELIAAGTEIARVLAEDAASATIATLTVQPWVPIADDAIAADPSGAAVRTDFAAHAWTADAGVVSEWWE